MAIIEKLAVLSDAQAITSDTASSNYFDMATAGHGYGISQNLVLCIRTNTAPTDAADTIAIELQTDASSSFNTGPTVVFSICLADTTEITVDDERFATAGEWIYRGALPYDLDRYVRLYYENSTSNGTITLDAWIEQAPQEYGTQVITSPVGTPS